jgi:beta-glucosidase
MRQARAACRLVVAGLSVLPFVLMCGGTAAAQPVRDVAEQRAEGLVAKMTVDEKIGQLVNVAPAIPRLGIPAYNWWTESLHGAMGTVPTTNFPEPIGLAASFDDGMVHNVAAAISLENRGLHALGRKTGKLGVIGTGLDTWSPNINIFRDPRWGRGQETYGEDPYLTATMGVAFVEGMQGPDPDLPNVISTPKHYAVHSGPETTRHKVDVEISAHDLEDTYLPAFRAAIVEAHAGSIMCAYNSLDGQPACANDLLLKERLRGAWDFKGYVVSDCDAVKDIADNHHYVPDQAAAVAAALKTGVDNECNVGTLGGGGDAVVARYKEALQRGLLTVADVDRALVRLFSARYRTGDLSGLTRPDPDDVPALAQQTDEHNALALQGAEESIVLLKNDGTLPLKPGVRIAVVGPLADATRVLRGNYSSMLSPQPISVVAGLRQAMPEANITLVPFGPSITDGNPVPESALRTPQGKPGLLAQYFNAVTPDRGASSETLVKTLRYAAKPVVTRIEPGVASRANELAKVTRYNRVVWTGFLVPPDTGTYRIALSGSRGSFKLDGKTVSKLINPRWGEPPVFKNVKLVKGKRYRIRVVAESVGPSSVELQWQRVSTDPEADLKAAAANADAIVAVVGLTSDLEGEESKIDLPGFMGGDRTSLDLPADQRQYLEQAKVTGKPLIVVAMNGSPIALQWAKQNAAAIVEAWYGGQDGGLAVANVLSGKFDPAGRLPLTFYRSVDDLPPFDDYAMKGRTYRYFSGTPVYSFGYGLSYTTFGYGPVSVEPVGGAAENGLRVTTEVTNTGAREGQEVAELYLTPPRFDGAPQLALRGFHRLDLKPGEKRQVTFELSPRDLSFVTADGVRQLVPGQYTVSVGSGQPDGGAVHQSAGYAIARAVKLPE